MDKKINFLHTCREAAAEAEKLFGMNARIILAQGALESGWGTSMLATEHHNFFGLMGYGASNAYWHGQRATFETAYGTHHFRHYEATHLSFLDFARLIRSAYPRAYHFSFQPEAYAKEIAYSPYISEQNGDNPPPPPPPQHHRARSRDRETTGTVSMDNEQWTIKS